MKQFRPADAAKILMTGIIGMLVADVLWAPRRQRAQMELEMMKIIEQAKREAAWQEQLWANR